MTPFKFHVRSGSCVLATGTIRNGRTGLALEPESDKLGGFTREVAAKIKDAANILAEDPRLASMTVFEGLYEVVAGRVKVDPR